MTEKINDLLKYLYALDGRGIRLGLERAQSLAEAAGNPQNAFPIIHVAGTNGKGSTCAMIYSLLRAAGFSTGLYTSPHLLRFNERIRVDDCFITDDEIITYMKKMQPAIDDLDATFFETTTVMALNHFAEKKVDVAVLEVGLGGRFDATNIFRPAVTAITPVGKDHEERLGNTLSKIAYEKAGIAKPGIPCVIARQRPGVMAELEKFTINNLGVPIPADQNFQVKIIASDIKGQTVDIHGIPGGKITAQMPLHGNHQAKNLQTALAAVSCWNQFTADPEIIKTGILNIRWPGRLQVLRKTPQVLYDVGHNLHGFRQVARTIGKIYPGQKFDIMLTLRGTKKIDGLGKILAGVANNIFISEIPGDEHTASPVAVHNHLIKHLPPERVHIKKFPEKLLEKYRNTVSAKPLLILGSHYIAPVVDKYFRLFT